MATKYTPIPFEKEAVQLAWESEPARVITIDENEFQIFRDSQGFYTLVNTLNGKQRANLTDWLMVESEASEGIPGVEEKTATGTYVVTEDATGNGVVGFSFRGIVYAISPKAGDTAAITSTSLVDLINRGGQMKAMLGRSGIVITSQLPGADGNIPLVDVTTDSTQLGKPSGFEGGADSSPTIPANPRLYSVWTNEKFNELFQPVSA